MQSIGIDIGSFSVKVAKVSSQKQGYELLSFSEYPLSQDPNKDTQIELVEILRDIKNRLWEDGTHIVIGAHTYELSMRRREFPFRERHKIAKSLPFELEDDIPFSAENSIFDAKITHFIGNAAHVLACAIPKDQLEIIIKRTENCGILPDLVSVDGIATANLFEEWRESPWEYPANSQPLPNATPVDLFLNIGHRTTTVGVIKDGYLLDLRLLDWGGKDIAELIAARYGMHYLEALKDLRKKAFILTNNEGATREQVALSEVIKSAVDNLTQKLRLTLLELKGLHKIEFHQALLVGGVSQLKNLGPYLTQKIEVATNRLGKLKTLPNFECATSPNNEVAHITAIGLALEGVKRPKNPAINFLRGDFARQNQNFRLFWDKWGHAAKMLALSFFMLLVWSIMRESFLSSNAELAYDQLRTHAKNITGSKRPSDHDVKTYIKAQEQRLKLKEMVDSLNGINSTLDILKQISSLAPNKKMGNLNVHTFVVNGETALLTGNASNTQLIEKLQSALKSVAKGGEVQATTAPTTAKKGYKSFSYSFKVIRKPGDN